MEMALANIDVILGKRSPGEVLRAYDTALAALDAAIAASGVIAKATVYRARVGTRPAFNSLAEAQLFENGWHAYHDGLACSFGGTPWSHGWLEAERSVEDGKETS